MARQTFTAAQVLTAAQMNTLQASVWSDDVNAQTGTSYGLVLADAGKQVTLSNTATVTVTIPTNATQAFAIGTKILLINLNTGSVVIAPAGGVTVNAPSGDLSIPRYGTALLIKTGTDTWVVDYPVDVDDDQAILAVSIFG